MKTVYMSVCVCMCVCLKISYENYWIVNTFSTKFWWTTERDFFNSTRKSNEHIWSTETIFWFLSNDDLRSWSHRDIKKMVSKCTHTHARTWRFFFFRISTVFRCLHTNTGREVKRAKELANERASIEVHRKEIYTTRDESKINRKKN